MGFLDSILGNGSASAAPEGEGALRVVVRFMPLRLSAMRANKINMVVSVKNDSNEPKLVSVDAMVSRSAFIGFDNACAQKHCEKRVGEIKPNASMEIAVPIFASGQTKAGEYGVSVIAYSHYLDYNKVIGQTRKTTNLRVV